MLFTSTLGALGSLIKRNLNKHTFLALSAYAALTTLQPRWTDALVRRADAKDNALKEGLHSIRASCLRSFPEFLADIRLAGMGPKGGEVGTGLAEFTVSVSARPALPSSCGCWANGCCRQLSISRNCSRCRTRQRRRC